MMHQPITPQYAMSRQRPSFCSPFDAKHLMEVSIHHIYILCMYEQLNKNTLTIKQTKHLREVTCKTLTISHTTHTFTPGRLHTIHKGELLSQNSFTHAREGKKGRKSQQQQQCKPAKEEKHVACGPLRRM